MKQFFLVLFLSVSFFCRPLSAQNLTGTWEGIMAGREKLTVCIKMKNREICGYTADRELSDPGSYCKATFKGWFDKDEQVWMLVGTSFMENSGEHILIMLRLWFEAGDPKNTLRGTVEAKSNTASLLGIGNGRDRVSLKRTSTRLPLDMPDCFPVIKKTTSGFIKKATIKPLSEKNKTITVNKVPPKKTPVNKSTVAATKKLPQKIPVSKKTVSPVAAKKLSPKKTTADPVLPIKVDTVQRISKVDLPPVRVSPEEMILLKKMNARKQTSLQHIVVNQKNIVLSVYDNGTIDNDTVSIFYNKKLIASKKKLSDKALLINLQLDENAAVHEIVMFAENLGTIAPNTALIVVQAGNKRYELHSSASLTENAVLEFEYKPE